MDLQEIIRRVLEISQAAETRGTKVDEALATVQRNAAGMGASLLELQQKLVAIESAASGSRRSHASGSHAIATALRSAQLDLVRSRSAPGSGWIAIPGTARALLTRSTLVHSSGDASPAAPGVAPATTRLPALGEMPLRRPLLLEVLPSIPVSTLAVEYLRLDGYTNAAAIQATEGAAKAEASVDPDLTTAEIRTIAHWLPVSRQVLSDNAQLQLQLQALLLNGVRIRAEDFVLNDADDGLNQLATPAVVSSTHPVDTIGEAAALSAAQGWAPDLVVLHPLDLFAIFSERATDGQYVGSGWTAPPTSLVWQMAWVTSPAQPRGHALVADSSQIAVLDREAAQFAISESHADFFIKNLLALRAEMRLGLQVLSPTSLLDVALPGISG